MVFGLRSIWKSISLLSILVWLWMVLLWIYWNSDSQTRIFDNFDKRENSRDLAILRQKIKKDNKL